LVRSSLTVGIAECGNSSTTPAGTIASCDRRNRHRSFLSGVRAYIETQELTMTEKQPIVVVVGGGFGGLSAAKALRKAPVKVLLIDRANHHLFQPLLYQVATSELSPGQIAWPIRDLLRKQQNTTVVMGEVTG